MLIRVKELRMNILVTGGAGYIGSHTCKELAARGHTVTVYDDLSTGWRDLVKWGDLVQGDIRDTEKLTNALRGCRAEGVIHFAGKSYVGDSVRMPGEYYSNNVAGTLSLLEAMREADVGRVIMSGTCSVYGQPEEMPISENTSLNPINPYGRTKLFMECILQDFEHAHGLNWMSLRYFNAAGCDADGETGERHVPETHLIPRVLMAAAGEIPHLELFGDDYDTPDGTCIRDYIHVRDLAVAHVLALEHLGQGGSSMPLNLGTGTGLSVRQIIGASERVSGRRVPVIVKARREGDPAVLTADAGRAREVIGWTPQFSSVEDVIASAWKWLLTDKPVPS